MKLDKIKERIQQLEKEKQANQEEAFLLQPQIDSLYKLLKDQETKSDKVTKGKLERTKKELREAREIAREEGNLDRYLELEKEIKGVNRQLREIKDTISYLTIQELRRLKTKVSRSNQGLKFNTIIQLAYEGGLRVSEVANLRISDINILEGTMLCRRGKGSETNTILLSRNCRKTLKDYLKEYEPREHLFINQQGKPYNAITLNDMFKRYCNKADIPKEKARFHSLKHSRAVHLADEGLMLQEIKHLLGHKSIASTMIYQSFTKNQEENIYSKLSGY